MEVTIRPSEIKGNIQAPSSKSSMQRACAAALLTKGKSIIRHPGHSNDDKAAIDIIKRMGAAIEMSGDEMIVHSEGVSPINNEINCGESGLSIRMFTPIVALSEKEITIQGSGSLVNRPMDFFDEIFPHLGIQIQSNKGKLPLKIKGPLQPKNIEIDGSLSSQFLTGLLMAYSAAGANGVSIKVNNLKSKPYVDLTLDVMQQFDLDLPENRDYKEFYFKAQDSRLFTPDYTVEGDWSGGAFLLVAGAIAGPITVRNLDLMSTQADKKIMEALDAANATVAIEAKGIKVRPGEMKAFEFDATDCPDLFPPLVALAAYCKGETRIKGLSRLAHKESDRGVTLQEEFGKMGTRISWSNDVMIIEGSEGLNGARVHSHHDHRVAMSCAVAALKANGDTVIEEADAVKKSYPDFYHDLKKLNANVSLINILKSNG